MRGGIALHPLSSIVSLHGPSWAVAAFVEGGDDVVFFGGGEDAGQFAEGGEVDEGVGEAGSSDVGVCDGGGGGGSFRRRWVEGHRHGVSMATVGSRGVEGQTERGRGSRWVPRVVDWRGGRSENVRGGTRFL